MDQWSGKGILCESTGSKTINPLDLQQAGCQVRQEMRKQERIKNG